MSNNRTIISNTLFLYLRMLVIISLSLYTTRIIFNTLGIENYGLFSLVASFVVLFSFLNSAMQSGTQRFLNVALSSGIQKRVQATFNAALNIHLAIAFLVLIGLETFGLWYLTYQLNIPSDKVDVAQVVYQFSVLTTILGIISVPYQALIVAKERMSLFAYIGIFEAVVKLLIAVTITYIGSNLLIAYSGLLGSMAVIVFLIYLFVSKKHFGTEIIYQFKTDIGLTKEMLGFSSWNFFGQVAVLSSNQGITILYNLFLGLTVSAAMAIAQQVRGLVGTLANSLQVAFNPQIVQSYAKGHIDRHNMLVLNASRYSLYLISIIAIPFLLYSDLILKIWLGDTLPTYAGFFVKVMVWVTILECLSGPFWMSAHARGDIKKYQLVISSIFLLNLPMTYLSFKLLNSAYWSFAPTIIVALIALVYRIHYFFNGNNLVKEETLFYFKSIGCMFTFLLVIQTIQILGIWASNTNLLLFNFLITLVIELIFLIFIIFCANTQERTLFQKFLKKLLVKVGV